jgi:hypothetical protein
MNANDYSGVTEAGGRFIGAGSIQVWVTTNSSENPRSSRGSLRQWHMRCATSNTPYEIACRLTNRLTTLRALSSASGLVKRKDH